MRTIVRRCALAPPIAPKEIRRTVPSSLYRECRLRPINFGFLPLQPRRSKIERRLRRRTRTGQISLRMPCDSEVATPNSDRLGARGMRFSQAYSGSTVCAPSRCALLTGFHTGHATIRGNKKPEMGLMPSEGTGNGERAEHARLRPVSRISRPATRPQQLSVNRSWAAAALHGRVTQSDYLSGEQEGGVNA
jgi:hypothetical protein